MSPNDSDVRSTTAKRTHGGADVQDVTAELDAIRADIQNLTSTLGRFANKQFGYARFSKVLAGALGEILVVE